MTLLVTALAFGIGLVGGFPIMLGLRSRIVWVRLVLRLFVDIVRGVPPIVWLFLIYFGVQLGTVRLDSLTASVVGLGVISSVYLAEMYRGGFQTLPVGQAEAAAALGLSRPHSFVFVLTPQAFRRVLPSVTTFLLSLVKDSSIASTIGVTDMVFMANQFARQNPDTAGIVPFVLAAVVYLIVSVPVALLARRLDSRMRAIAVVEVGRGVPALVVLYMVYFGLPAFGLLLENFAAAATALTFTVAAYSSEMIRAGIASVPRGQREASQALGLEPTTLFLRIILPQGMRSSIPALMGLAIMSFQGTSLAYSISVNELMSQAYQVSTITFEYLAVYGVTGLIFAAIAVPATWLPVNIRNTRRSTMTRYCVIGGGAAGMSALQQLCQAGYEVDCYEKSDRVGGHWQHDYDALHLITSRDMTYFEGFPMPRDYPHFPSRKQVVAYLEAYAREHGLYDLITFGTAVESVTPVGTDGPVGSAGWTVTLSTGERIEYDGVLVANGHLWDQKIPSFPGEFSGKTIHSGSYRNTGDIEGDRVLVVGVGNSGCDLAVDAAQHQLQVDVVMRRAHFQPKMYFGVPRQEVPWLAEFAPDEVDLLSRLLARVSIGEAKNYPGMPEPKSRSLAEGRAVVNTLIAVTGVQSSGGIGIVLY
ncbi:hypothetical protein FQR65_LT20532 [Abscondita terminalis]|nr:hypothetical protein FQR65_LT20532 [Abscondita terminalis]